MMIYLVRTSAFIFVTLLGFILIGCEKEDCNCGPDMNEPDHSFVGEWEVEKHHTRILGTTDTSTTTRQAEYTLNSDGTGDYIEENSSLGRIDLVYGVYPEQNIISLTTYYTIDSQKSFIGQDFNIDVNMEDLKELSRARKFRDVDSVLHQIEDRWIMERK